ncbi:sensor histidine kinase, partial [Paenibacillus sp. MCAF20]
MFYSLRNRLIAIFVLLFVLAFCTMSILIFNQSRSMIRDHIESSALEKMDEYGSYISMVQTQVYDWMNTALISAWYRRRYTT